jgi:hypothetical protein
MKRVYDPRVGVLRAHRIGMTTRIVYIFLFGYVLVRVSDVDTVPELRAAGSFWLLLVLAFEWVGSFTLRRPVREILEGWHVEKGYMWLYVLMVYLLSPLVTGLVANSL